VIAPGGATRQAYSYNMHANFFYPFTALQRPFATGAAVVTDGVTNALNILGEISCLILAEILGEKVGVSTNDAKFTSLEIPGVATCGEWFGNHTGGE